LAGGLGKGKFSFAASGFPEELAYTKLGVAISINMRGIPAGCAPVNGLSQDNLIIDYVKGNTHCERGYLNTGLAEFSFRQFQRLG
jgi:hypothetical protein